METVKEVTLIFDNKGQEYDIKVFLLPERTEAEFDIIGEEDVPANT